MVDWLHRNWGQMMVQSSPPCSVILRKGNCCDPAPHAHHISSPCPSDAQKGLFVSSPSFRFCFLFSLFQSGCRFLHCCADYGQSHQGLPCCQAQEKKKNCPSLGLALPQPCVQHLYFLKCTLPASVTSLALFLLVTGTYPAMSGLRAHCVCPPPVLL